VPVIFGSQALWALAVLLNLGLGSWRAHAQSLAGSWRAGATSIKVDVESWGADCGARPASMRSKGGGVVSVEQQDQTLLLHGRDQDIRTDTCWSQNPAMKRVLASYASGQWLTRCRTADDDPRAEQGTYTLKQQDANTLLYTDTSRYDWTLNQSKCVATFTTTQTLTRINKSASSSVASNTPSKTTSDSRSNTDSNVDASTGARAEASANTAEDSTTRSGCKPGPATRLTLRPKRAAIELGQRVCFKARVTDAANCALSRQDLNWSLEHSAALRGTLNNNCFTAADSAAEGEGEFRVTVKRGNLQAQADVVVRRVDLSSLIARRMEGTGLEDSDDDNEAVAEVPAPVSTTVAKVATGAETDDDPSLPLLIGLTVAALLTAAAVWAASRRKAEPEPAIVSPSSWQEPAAVEGHNRQEPAAPLGQRSWQEPAASGRPDTAVPMSAPVSPPQSQRAQAGTWICPTCRVGYPAQQGVCPKDGTPLVSYADFTQRQKRASLEHTKRCPKCGQTFPSNASFCAEDGTSLISIQ